ncbi:MAG TPA: hypothetical protein VGE45_09280 [Chloroflexia bacterium]|jgi:hypothetical protein
MMALRRPGLLLFALLLALTSTAFPTTITHAQGNSRTFPETGKTVSGRFFTYWEGHGGLAQQGYPITEEIQETSATDGKIYTVQYFERAVFEYHPENKAPNDVLLQLLGVFLYGDKYPEGAPGETPNEEPGSRLFNETQQRLGGIFLQYWTTHGGLAQQGLPISDEFEEKSDLDGKTYKVQYFERAVFEYHPEKQPPFNVLLSQLGTFRNRANYGTLARQLNGTGNQQPTAPFALKAGLAIFQSVRANTDGYFYIDLHDAAGKNVATVGYGSGPRDVSSAVNVPQDGMYVLDVQAEEGWTVNVSQPKATYSPPPATQSWSGHALQTTGLFSLKAGPATFHVVSAGNKEEFRVYLLDANGVGIGTIANATGPGDVTTTSEIPADGVYIIEIQVDADWTLEVQQ